MTSGMIVPKLALIYDTFVSWAICTRCRIVRRWLVSPNCELWHVWWILKVSSRSVCIRGEDIVVPGKMTVRSLEISPGLGCSHGCEKGEFKSLKAYVVPLIHLMNMMNKLFIQCSKIESIFYSDFWLDEWWMNEYLFNSCEWILSSLFIFYSMLCT